jgi:hypothetical protein
MKRILLILTILSPLMGWSQPELKIDSIQGYSVPIITSSTSQVKAFHTIVGNYSSTSLFNDTLKIVVAVEDSFGQPQIMDIVFVGNRIIPPMDTADIDTVVVDIIPSFFAEGNNTVVIWPSCTNALTIDTFYVDIWYSSIAEMYMDDINVTVGPNPAINHICLGDPSNLVKQVRFRDMDGRLVGTGSTNTILQLNLNSGMYIIELETADKRVYTRKLIIRR